MTANDEEENHAIKITEQQKQIDMLESDLHETQSKLEQLELKFMESESRLQIEVCMFATGPIRITTL